MRVNEIGRGNNDGITICYNSTIVQTILTMFKPHLSKETGKPEVISHCQLNMVQKPVTPIKQSFSSCGRIIIKFSNVFPEIFEDARLNYTFPFSRETRNVVFQDEI